MADLKVDYQLLAAMHGTLTGLVSEFESIEDRVGACGPACGSADVTAAMGAFAGNWSDHRATLLGGMRNLDHMVTVTAQRFHQADSQLASDLTRK